MTVYRDGTPDVCGCSGTGCCNSLEDTLTALASRISNAEQDITNINTALQGKMDTASLSAYATITWTTAQIAAAVSDMATQTWTTGAINSAITSYDTTLQASLNANYATITWVQNQLNLKMDNTTLSGYATQAWVTTQLGSISGVAYLNGINSFSQMNTFKDVTVNDSTALADLTVSGTAAFSGSVTVPTEATGTYSTIAANSTKVKNELDAYTPMMRTTNNQNISGNKTFIDLIYGKTAAYYYRNLDSKNGYVKVYQWTNGTQTLLIDIIGNSSNNVGYYTNLLVSTINPTNCFITFINSAYQNISGRVEAILTYDGTNYELWFKFISYRYANVSIRKNIRYGAETQVDNSITIDGTNYTAKPDANDYTTYIDVTDATS